jgi:hypothetical protein
LNEAGVIPPIDGEFGSGGEWAPTICGVDFSVIVESV